MQLVPGALPGEAKVLQVIDQIHLWIHPVLEVTVRSRTRHGLRRLLLVYPTIPVITRHGKVLHRLFHGHHLVVTMQLARSLVESLVVSLRPRPRSRGSSREFSIRRKREPLMPGAVLPSVRMGVRFHPQRAGQCPLSGHQPVRQPARLMPPRTHLVRWAVGAP